jgi:ribonuclease BN (tRNA processing enzyme)
MPGWIGKLSALAFVALAVGFPALAAPAKPAADSQTQILFLGTGGGPPLRINRSEPSTLLIVDGRYYLIDCGIGTARRLVEAGVESKDIKTIFFTHLHADHDMGLVDVMANDFFTRGPEGAANAINIYGPPQTRELVDAAFRFVSIGFRPFAAEVPEAYQKDGASFSKGFVGHDVNAGGIIFEDDKIRIRAVENSHYALMPAPDSDVLKSFAYRIETPGGVIVFTGDTGPSGAIGQFARGADVLIAEASYRDPDDLDQSMKARAARSHVPPAVIKRFHDHFVFEHLDAAAIARLAAQAGAKSVVLYHFTNGEADQSAYVSSVEKGFSGPVFAPADLDRYCLGSRVLRPCGHGARQ